MMKELPDPVRRRRLPEHFSWVDHRLVRDGHFRGCGNEALALYLFLVTVGDADGVSWYSDRSLGQELNCDSEHLRRLRRELLNTSLIAWNSPFYQVLDLDAEKFCGSLLSKQPSTSAGNPEEAVSLGDIIAGMLKGGGGDD